MVVIAHAEPLHVPVQAAAQVVRHPLTHTRGQVFISVRAERIKNSDQAHSAAGEQQYVMCIQPNSMANELKEPAMRLLVADHIVDHDLERPWLCNVGDTFANNA